MTRKARILTSSAATMVFLVAVSFFWIVPHVVDFKANGLPKDLLSGPQMIVPPLHQSLHVVDLHADTLLWDRDLLKWGTRGHVDLPRLQQGNFTLQIFSVVTKSPRDLNYKANESDSDNITILAAAERWPLPAWFSLTERALYQAHRLREFANDSHGQLRIILNRGDLEQLLRDREKDHELVGGILSMEGAHALEGDLSRMEDFEKAGFRQLAPAHLFDTDLAGSQQGAVKGGLTELGKKWVADMNRRHLIIDLAHVSGAAIDDTLKLSTLPVIVSHTGFKGVCESNRNLSDDQMKAIAAKGGIIGAGFWPEVNCGEGLDPIVKSIRYGIKTVGIDHIALGSDWDGFVSTAIDSARIGWLTAKLLEAGMTEIEIRKVMGENAIQFYLQNLP